MTMPEKIWAGAYETNVRAGDWDVDKEFSTDTAYIRADIAEELALALEDALANGCSVKTLDALDRYRQLTP